MLRALSMAIYALLNIKIIFNLCPPLIEGTALINPIPNKARVISLARSHRHKSNKLTTDLTGMAAVLLLDRSLNKVEVQCRQGITRPINNKAGTTASTEIAK